VAASSPNAWISGFEVLVHNESAVLDESTFVDEVEVPVFDVACSAADAHAAVQIFNGLLHRRSFVAQLLHLFLLAEVFLLVFLDVLAFELDSAEFVVQEFVVGVVAEGLAFVDAHSEFPAPLDYIVLEFFVFL